MKEYDFNVDIKEILKKEHKEKEEILSKNFAYTYLVFDCDLHHPKKSENRVTKDIVNENFKMLKEMAQYFIDETDPTIGKLYINYPMMESYRDSDSFFEEAFAKRKISLSKLKGYKQEVAARKLCKIHIDQYEKRHFELLILQNLYKWHFTCHGLWDKPEYNLYIKETDNLSLLTKQQQLSIEQDCLSVINTSLFLILDYYGNRDDFYQKLNINC